MASEFKKQQFTVCAIGARKLRCPDVLQKSFSKDTNTVATDFIKNIWLPFVVSYRMIVLYKINIKF